MLSKLTNGLAGTWDSLDQRERILLIYCAGAVVYFLMRGLTSTSGMKRIQKEDAMASRIARKIRETDVQQRSWDEREQASLTRLADLIAERLK